MAATNRPEVLDAALLRPGRFDRQVLVDRPHREGRRAILGVHVRPLTLADGVDGVDLDSLAAQPPGFVGADLANLCNEAALLAARKDHSAVQMEDFQDAIERVIGGLEKKGRFISEEERRTVAYHESGRTLVGHFTPGADPVQKVSIVPRGRAALGYTLQMPTEDRYLLSRGDLLGRVRVLLGGRAAEQTVFGEISTGASDDLEKASAIVRQMLTAYGMSERLPNLLLVQPAANGFLGQGRSWRRIPRPTSRRSVKSSSRSWPPSTSRRGSCWRSTGRSWKRWRSGCLKGRSWRPMTCARFWGKGWGPTAEAWEGFAG